MTGTVASSNDTTATQSRRRHSYTHEAVTVLAALLVVTSLFYYEVVFFGRTLVPITFEGSVMGAAPYGFTGQRRPDPYRLDTGASTWAIVPFASKVGKEYASGRFPLWNEHQGFGSPLLANAQSGGMDPLRLPVLLTSSPPAWDFYYLARTLLGALATYLFARVVRLCGVASFVFAVAFVFSGHFMIFGNNHWIEVYFLLPVVLLGTEVIILGRNRAGFAVTSLAVALSILAGMPEATLFVLLLGAAYGAYRFVMVATEVKDIQPLLRRSASLIGAWVVGLALAAPLLLTLFEYIPNSYSSHSPSLALGLVYAPLSEFVLLGIPFLNGLPRAPVVKGTELAIIHTYVGATVLILALCGLYPARTRLHRHLAVLMALAVILLLAKAYGVPGINALGLLPGLNVTMIPKWSAPVTGFCLAFLASLGVHRLLTAKAGPTLATPAFISFTWFALLGLLLNWNTVVHASSSHLWSTLGIAYLFATAIWAVLKLRRWVHSTVIAQASCALVILELFVYAPRGVYQDRHDPLAEPPFVRFLRAQQVNAPFRIHGIEAVLFPNFATAYGIDDVRALDALYIDRYLAYVQNFVSPTATDRFVGTPNYSAEKEARIRDNPWFNLTGVRYVVTRPGGEVMLADRSLIEAILGANAGSAQAPAVGAEVFTIGGVSKPVLFEHPPASLRYPLTVTPDRAVLRFSPALSPQVWDPSKGDGVGFEVAVESDGKRETLYRREIDPKNDASQRRWIEDNVDLSRFTGRNVVLVLTTDPLKSSDYDWAGWADIRLTPASSTPPTQDADAHVQYTMVYDAEVQIFENRQALPRAFLVSSLIAVADKEAALAMMKGGGIDPARTAVVEGLSSDQAATISPNGGTVTIRSYVSTDVVIDVDAKGPSFLVLTDSYYPGWQATVDGREAAIYATDLAFRGVFVPEGQHRVEFSYRPLSFTLGLSIAVVGFVVLVGVSTGFDPRRSFANRQVRLREEQAAR